MASFSHLRAEANDHLLNALAFRTLVQQQHGTEPNEATKQYFDERMTELTQAHAGLKNMLEAQIREQNVSNDAGEASLAKDAINDLQDCHRILMETADNIRMVLTGWAAQEQYEADLKTAVDDLHRTAEAFRDYIIQQEGTRYSQSTKTYLERRMSEFLRVRQELKEKVEACKAEQEERRSNELAVAAVRLEDCRGVLMGAGYTLRTLLGSWGVSAGGDWFVHLFQE